MIEQNIESLESLLKPWKQTIGADYAAYRNHVYRMLHFCFYLGDTDETSRQKLIIAGAFHDIGIWTAGTLDYLDPSVTAAHAYLRHEGLEAWREEIRLMIDMHHKITPFRAAHLPLVERFRQADLVDFSLGWVKFGIPREYITEVKRSFPNQGFHKRLKALAWSRLKSHPANPLPMMRW
ncbi:MAG: hypothetical protein ABW076_15630 [Candidatus Thiodiazotropha sp.]